MDSEWFKGAPLQGEDHTQRPRHQVALASKSPWHPVSVALARPRSGTYNRNCSNTMLKTRC